MATKPRNRSTWKTLGYHKIGVIYPDEAFGSTVLQGVENALKKENAAPVATASYVRQTSQVGGAIEKVKQRRRTR